MVLIQLLVSGLSTQLVHNRLNKLQSFSLPSSSYINLTLGASGTNYTAPADGWFVFWGATTGENNLYFRNLTIDEPNQERRVYTAVGLTCSHPVPKNNIFSFRYDHPMNNVIFRFYYALGSAPQS